MNGYQYCYASLTILKNISHLFEYTNLSVLFLPIQFSISALFAHSLNVK